jgi:hypothetical protein
MVSVVVLVVVHTLSHFCLVSVMGTFWHAWVQQHSGQTISSTQWPLAANSNLLADSGHTSLHLQ